MSNSWPLCQPGAGGVMVAVKGLKSPEAYLWEDTDGSMLWASYQLIWTLCVTQALRLPLFWCIAITHGKGFPERRCMPWLGELFNLTQLAQQLDSGKSGGLKLTLSGWRIKKSGQDWKVISLNRILNMEKQLKGGYRWWHGLRKGNGEATSYYKLVILFSTRKLSGL